MKSTKRYLALLLLALASAFSAGCISGGGQSTMPWAQQQPWENQVPGMGGIGGGG